MDDADRQDAIDEMVADAIADFGDKGRTGQLDGIRTHNRTNVKTRTTHAYEIRNGYIYISGGPTGYESCSLGIVEKLRNDPKAAGWVACFGTPGRYDELIITRDSLLREFPSD